MNAAGAPKIMPRIAEDFYEAIGILLIIFRCVAHLYVRNAVGLFTFADISRKGREEVRVPFAVFAFFLCVNP